jgi:site-specific DNA-methyltransferase (adenine-specific)
MEPNSICKMDCLEGISSLPDSSIHLCITSPPYNLGNTAKKKKIVYNTYKDDKDFLEYIAWLKSIFTALWDKLTDDGRVCINIGDQQNGSIPTSVFISSFLIDIGYKPFTTIIWNKSQVSNRTSWGSWLSPSSPSFPTPFEYILVFYKNSRKLIHKGESDLTREEFITNSLALWSFPPETKMKKFGHPAMFPEELPRRLIKMFSYKGDIVLDPFSGCGTTLKVAKDLGRQFIGFEIDDKYIQIAIDRIKGK